VNIDKFKQDHEAISKGISQVVAALAAAAGGHNTEALVAGVQQLFGKLSVHLALEDQVLYPKLRESTDDSVRELARRFETQMGGIKRRFEEYKNRWPGKIAVAKDPTAFVAETKKLIAALIDRVRREDSELYPAAERAG
jgi:hemerythrin-like domain-containing protein